MEPILDIHDLSVTFDTKIQRIRALHNVSLCVNRGEIIGIIGASGSGKSTLAKAILGLQSKNQTTQGRILFLNGANESQDLLTLSPDSIQVFRRKESTIVFQNPLLNLNPLFTIKDHFDRLLGLSKTKGRVNKIADALNLVDLGSNIDQILSSYPHQLSGGQQQRILIALAICQQVQLLILDEPISSLDKRNQEGISRILRQLVADNAVSIILISHDLHVISELSDRVYVINEGEIVEESLGKEILLDPKHDYTKELVQARHLKPKSAVIEQESPLIRIDNLTHTYRKGGFLSYNSSSVTALTDISLTINKGKITGLVGSSGSGKSTLVEILLGNLPLQKGSILWDGDSFKSEQSWKRIQIVPQNTTDALNPRMLMDDQLREVYLKCYPESDSYNQVINQLATDVGLNNELRNRYPSELSGGEIQRMAILRALIVRPDILILDESLSALDMLVQAKLVDLIKELNSKLNMSIILISHDDRLISTCCDYIIRLEQGAIVSM